MKNTIFLAILLHVLLLNACDFKQSKEPSLKFRNTTHDFKSIVIGGQPVGTFLFENISSDTVEVSEISVECDCVSFNKKIPIVIPPRGLDSIVVSFNSNASYIGLHNKYIILRTNGFPRTYSLKITGTVTSSK